MKQNSDDWSDELIDGNSYKRYNSHPPQKEKNADISQKNIASECERPATDSPFILRDDSL